MGALTTKVYSFIGRVWEVEKIETIDYFDSFGVLLFVEKRNFEIIRIIPRISKNFDWITDKVRFFFDGLKYQRLFNPLIFDNRVQFYVSVNWFVFYFFMKSLFSLLCKRRFLFNVCCFINEQLDLVDIKSLRNFIYNFTNLYNFVRGDVFQSTFLINTDYLNLFYFDEKLLKNNLNIVSFGSDFRLELPLLYLSFLKKVKENSLVLYFFGYVYYLNIPYTTLGSNFFDFINFSLGKSLKLKVKDSIYFLFSSFLFNDVNFGFFYNKIRNLFEQLVVKLKIDVYYMIMHNNLINLNLTYFGELFNNIGVVLLNDKINLKLFDDLTIYFIIQNKIKVINLKKTLSKIFKIEYAYTFDFDFSNFVDFKLPIPYIYEKDFYTFDVFGFLHKSKYVYFPMKVNEIRSLYLIINKISLLVNLKKIMKIKKKIISFVFLNVVVYNNFVLEKIKNTKEDLFNVIKKIDYVKENTNEIKSNSDIFIYKYLNTFVTKTVYEYYKLESIVRNSPTLQLMAVRDDEIRRF